MDISKSRVLTVDDYLPLAELSLDRAVSVLPENLRTNFETAWRWFISMSGTTGTRMLGKRIPGVTDDFPISAQRGIHVPSRSGIALSVTVARGSIYSATDQPFIELPNGTWILEYSAHRNNTGGETDTRWNDGLLRCLKLGLPVGVFIQKSGSNYERYLAYVEEYHPERGVFTLHGPITTENSQSYLSELAVQRSPLAVEYTGGGEVVRHIGFEELEEDNRKYAEIRRVVREGQGLFRKKLIEAYDGRCACTGCDVPETLQAAHIVSYRGSRSNITSNGLLLRADLHLLFDSSLISVDPNSYELVTSNRLSNTDYSVLHGRRIRLPKRRELMPNESYLAAHFNKFRQIELAS